MPDQALAAQMPDQALAAQMPDQADLLDVVPYAGTVSALYRLGDDMVARSLGPPEPWETSRRSRRGGTSHAPRQAGAPRYLLDA
jgi:hypothetical protein